MVLRMKIIQELGRGWGQKWVLFIHLFLETLKVGLLAGTLIKELLPFLFAYPKAWSPIPRSSMLEPAWKGHMIQSLMI